MHLRDPGDVMKKSATILGTIIALTVVFYLLAYFYLPPPPPSPMVVSLFAAIAIALVFLSRAILRKLSLRKPRQRARNNRAAMLLLIPAVASVPSHDPPMVPAPPDTNNYCRVVKDQKVVLLPTSKGIGASCADAYGNVGTVVPPPDRPAADAGNERGPQPSRPPAAADGNPSPPPPPPSVPANSPSTSLGGLFGGKRTTGYAFLLHLKQEEAGYGLYSYALIAHSPNAQELPRYRAFVGTLLSLPTASSVRDVVGKSRTNITYLLLDADAKDPRTLSTDARIDYIISHYDYGRSAAILSLLPNRVGPGPVLTSVLSPITFTTTPHPVLEQDLSTAQPVLMTDYVTQFTNQVAEERFWKADVLSAFALDLRNVLETAAIGLGMSKDAVHSWVTYTK